MATDIHLDHVLIAVRDLESAAGSYRRLGFNLTAEGLHPGRGTHNRLIAFGPEYLELIAVHDPSTAPFRSSMAGFLEQGEGLYMFALGTGDIISTAAAIRARGAAVGEPVPGKRAAGAGPGYTWRSADLGRALPGSECFLIQHDLPITERLSRPHRQLTHTNLVGGVRQITLAVRDSARAARAWQEVLGLEFEPAVAVEGVLRHRLALGNCFIDLASPLGPGALNDFLSAAGEGPYELGLRTADVGAASAAIDAGGADRSPIVNAPEGRTLCVAGHSAAGVRLRLVEA